MGTVDACHRFMYIIRSACHYNNNDHPLFMNTNTLEHNISQVNFISFYVFNPDSIKHIIKKPEKFWRNNLNKYVLKPNFREKFCPNVDLDRQPWVGESPAHIEVEFFLELIIWNLLIFMFDIKSFPGNNSRNCTWKTYWMLDTSKKILPQCIVVMQLQNSQGCC